MGKFFKTVLLSWGVTLMLGMGPCRGVRTRSEDYVETAWLADVLLSFNLVVEIQHRSRRARAPDI